MHVGQPFDVTPAQAQKLVIAYKPDCSGEVRHPAAGTYAIACLVDVEPSGSALARGVFGSGPIKEVGIGVGSLVRSAPSYDGVKALESLIMLLHP